jgi:hypothetical protein
MLDRHRLEKLNQADGVEAHRDELIVWAFDL